MEAKDEKLHVVFLPYLTPSHMIPLVDMGRLFAARGVAVTIVTTPHNALLVRTSIDQDIKLGHPICIRELKFPAKQVGLPEGIENFNAITSNDMSAKVFYGIMLLKKPIEDLIKTLSPDCIFSDMFYPWTADLAIQLNIPRLLFYPSSFLYHCVTHSLTVYAPHESVESDTDSFLIPNLPDEIVMKRCQLQEHVKTKTRYGELIKAIKESEIKSYGMVHHTFYELEPAYADHYGEVKKCKFWHIGPIFQFFREEKAETEEQHHCLTWLDTQKPDSVLYICFGSVVRFSDTQLTELALALEASNHPFIWVVRKGVDNHEDETWLPSVGFQERIKESNRGMIVRDWVPQVKILDHPATGGFMTHCGWNSVLEAIVAGVPLVTWPLFAEHFYNEKLTELLDIGVAVGANVWNAGVEITSPVVGRVEIENAISRLMNHNSDESIKIKQRAKEVSAMAQGAVKDGGSSSNHLMNIIQEIKAVALEKTMQGPEMQATVS